MKNKLKNIKHNIKTISDFYIYFNGSAEVEAEGYRGITHLIEHCMCEKVKTFEKQLEKYAVDWNACTNSAFMKFYMHGLSKYVKKFSERFTEAILSYEITPEVFERERQIVLIEYKEHFSEKYSTYVSNYFRKYFGMTGAIGTVKDLENITYDKFMEFKNKYYSKPSEIVYLHPYNERGITELKACQEFNDIPESQFNYIYDEQKDFKYESYSEFIGQEIIAYDSGVIPYNKDMNVIASLLYIIDILSSGLSSPMYSILREKYECIYGLHSNMERLNENNCILFFYLFTPTEKKEIALEKFKEIISNMKKYLTKKQFNNTKTSFSNYVKREIATTVFNIIGGQNDEQKEKLKNILLKKTLTYEEFMEYINKITSIKCHFYNTLCEEV